MDDKEQPSEHIYADDTGVYATLDWYVQCARTGRDIFEGTGSSYFLLKAGAIDESMVRSVALRTFRAADPTQYTAFARELDRYAIDVGPWLAVPTKPRVGMFMCTHHPRGISAR